MGEDKATALIYPASLVPKFFDPESARKNAEAFVTSCKEYKVCPENAHELHGYMLNKGIAPTVEGFYHAFWILYTNGKLIRHKKAKTSESKKAPLVFSGYTEQFDQNALQNQQSYPSGWLQSSLGAGISGAVGAALSFNEIVKLNDQANSWSSIEGGASLGSAGSMTGGSGLKTLTVLPLRKAPAPKAIVESVPDHGGARRFRNEDD